MMDQANRLRSIVKSKNDQEVSSTNANSARVITITSGKGGVGKTNFAINLAILLRKHNKKVVIIDADFGLANIEVLFGVIPKFNLSHVFSGEKMLEEILTEGPMGIKFISGGSGLRQLANISENQMSFIIEKFAYLDTISDYILIDTGAGISNSVINFVKAANETIIVTSPEPTSITDAYAVIKAIKEENSFVPEFRILVNRVEDENEGKEIYEKINKVSEKFLNIKLDCLGSIPYDHNLVKAVKRQEPVAICYNNSASVKSIDKICMRLIENNYSGKNTASGVKSFVKRLITIFSSAY